MPEPATETSVQTVAPAEKAVNLPSAGGAEKPHVDQATVHVLSKLQGFFSTDTSDTSKPDAMLQMVADSGASLSVEAATVTSSDSHTEIKSATESAEENKSTALMTSAEQGYLDENKQKMSGLEALYVDERTNAAYVQQQIAEFAGRAGLEHDEAAELVGKAYDAESQQIVAERIQSQIDILFNSDRGTRNAEKQQIVTNETRRYLDLVTAAKAEGDLPQDLDASTVLQLVEQNVWTLAFQDRVASENLLGDHGVRHLVGHNITATESMFDQLAAHGQTVKAVDRLITHQVMIDHDIGYAMDPVRMGVNEGNFGIDRGHNLLAAKYEHERADNTEDPLRKVFSADQLGTIHKGILHHDSSKVDFKIGDPSDAARKDNIYSGIHLADNSHAFFDKVPELLYTNSDTLRFMRLMKAAGEIGDDGLFGRLQADLVIGIQANENFSPDDKVALSQAAHTLKPDSYRFTVGRLCGNKPVITIDNQGNAAVAVQESVIHQDVIGLFDQASLVQLRKFAGDLTGVDKDLIDLDKTRIVSADGKVEIKIAVSENRAKNIEGDYQQRLTELIADTDFQEFVIGNGVDSSGDAQLARSQSNLQLELAQHEVGSDMHTQIIDRIAGVKGERKANLERYMSKKD